MRVVPLLLSLAACAPDGYDYGGGSGVTVRFEEVEAPSLSGELTVPGTSAEGLETGDSCEEAAMTANVPNDTEDAWVNISPCRLSDFQAWLDSELPAVDVDSDRPGRIAVYHLSFELKNGRLTESQDIWLENTNDGAENGLITADFDWQGAEVTLDSDDGLAGKAQVDVTWTQGGYIDDPGQTWSQAITVEWSFDAETETPYGNTGSGIVLM